MVLSILVGFVVAQASGCTKDTDCKGDRICEAGTCVAPGVSASSLLPPPPPPPPPPVDPASYPRVVRREGQVCVQTLEASGRVEESCRGDESSARRRPLPAGTSQPAEHSDPSYPRVVRRDGQVCVQALDETGRVEESCRREDVPPPATPRRGARSRDVEAAAPVEPRSRFVADVLFHGGLMLLAAGGNAFAMPQLGGSLALGGRFSSGVGVLGLAQVTAGFSPIGPIIAATFAPALRFGDQSHFLIALGPGLLAFTGNSRSVSGLIGSLITQGVFSIAGAFVLTLQGSLHFDASGVAFVFGVGFGFGAL